MRLIMVYSSRELAMTKTAYQAWLTSHQQNMLWQLRFL